MPIDPPPPPRMATNIDQDATPPATAIGAAAAATVEVQVQGKLLAAVQKSSHSQLQPVGRRSPALAAGD